jgi:DNA-binding LacI/PurR family transcriptional regulator
MMKTDSLKSDKPAGAKPGRGGDTNAKFLSARIREMALERGPSAKLPTARQLCDILGTTRATLHNALGELEAQKIITRKQGSGIFVSPALHRKSIAVALNSSLFSGNTATSPFWGIFLGILVGEAQKRSAVTNQDYHFQIVTQEAAWVESLLDSLKTDRLRGVITVGLSSGHLIEQARVHDFAIVSYAGSGRWQVSTDADEMIRLGARSLADQGGKRIGLWRLVDPAWKPKYDEEVWEERIDVFRQVLAERNLPFDRDLVKDYRHLKSTPNAAVPEIYQSQGYHIAMEVFGGGGGSPIPDCVLCTDDMMTVGALAALQNLGVAVGRDLKIATQSNVGSLVFYGHEDKMTLVDVNPATLAATIFDILERALAGERPTEGLVKISPTIRC